MSKFNFSVCRLVKIVSRAGPQNVMFTRALPRRQPVHNETIIDGSIIKWVQYACVSTMKFQSSIFKLFIKSSIYFIILGKAVCFVAPRPPLLLSASPRATTAVSGPQNTLFPSVSVHIVRQIEGKNLLYRGTIPFCLHIVP